MSQILSGIGSLASAANTTVGIGNVLGREYNTYKARTEDDPEKRKLYNAREVCLSKFNWDTFIRSSKIILLPFLVLILIVLTDKSFKITEKNKDFGTYLYTPMILWILGSWFYTSYQYAYKWNIQKAKINMAEKINMDTCNIEK